MSFQPTEPVTIGKSKTGGAEIFRVDYDAKHGVLRSICKGFWVVDDVEPYIQVTVRYMQQAQRAHGRVLYMIDRRECPVQSPEIIARFTEGARAVVRDTDRFAFVSSSPLVRGQFARVFGKVQGKTFDDPDEAMAWLLTYI